MAPGQTIAHYRIHSKLGEGGMGQVWRATDTKLNRDVAIKILSQAFAQDSDRMARFQREAHVLASLNHPNIAAIYGIEQNALVMELVEGPDLHGPLPIEAALDYARQIAGALDAAHERGIIHRDLKPSNIKIRSDGTVKLLDFGLAKVTDEISGNLPDSPTISMSMTQVGVILGTAAYMSPEQARGKSVDKRADIWAFGVVLFEMLSGKMLYGEGETVTDTIAAVVLKSPNWSALPADTPSRIRRLLELCLSKDPRQRLRDIGDARLILDEPEPAAAPVPPGAPSRLRRALPWAATAVALTVGVATGAWVAAQKSAALPMRLNVDLGQGVAVGASARLLFSPAGERLLFVGNPAPGRIMLYSRLLEESTAQPLVGTEGLFNVDAAFSPNGQSIVFYRAPQLWKLALNGGAPELLCEAPGANRGISWGDNGEIVFASSGGKLRRVAESGANAANLTDPESVGDSAHSWPQILPGGNEVLFTAAKRTHIDYEGADIKTVSLRTGEIRTVQPRGQFGRYVPSGHLLFVRDGRLYAARFDLGAMKIRGPAVPVVESVAGGILSGWAAFDVARNGTLAYVPGNLQSARTSISWMDAGGRITPIIATLGDYRSPAFSPDGKRLAYTIVTERTTDLWVYDVARETPTQLTFNVLRSVYEVVWTHDGKRLLYGSRSPDPGMWSVRADGSGVPERLSSNDARVHAISTDGTRIAFTRAEPTGSTDIFTAALDTSDPEHPKLGPSETFLATPNLEVDPTFSPDGHWLAYSSTESGTGEIFVRPFPPQTGGKVKISTGGGKFPLWSPDVGELFFVAADGHIMVVNYAVRQGNFEAGKPRVWSVTPIFRTGVIRNLDLHPDGKRFAVFPIPENTTTPERGARVTFILNFFEELKRKVP